MASGHETIETDRFDAVSRHVLLVDKQTGSDVGTVRVIVPPSDAVAGDDAVLPIQELTSAPIIRNPDVIANAVEISRTCIIGAYRSGRREGQRDENSSAQTQGGTPPSRELTRIDSFMLPLGLFQFSARTALKTGRLTILTLMTRAFQRQLWRLGIQLTPVGAPVNLYGLRYPCLQPDLSVMFETMYRTHRGAWVIVSNHGELHDLALNLHASIDTAPIHRVHNFLGNPGLTTNNITPGIAHA